MNSLPTAKSGLVRRISLSRLIFYLGSLGVLVLIYFKFDELLELQTSLTKADFLWLAIALGLQLLTYYFIALNYKYVIRIKGHNVSARTLYPVAFIVQFLNQVLPSGTISGQIFFVDFLKKRGLNLAESIGRAILEFITMLCAFGILFIVAGFLISQKSIIGSHPELGLFVYIFLGVATLFLAIFFLFQKRDHGRLISWLVKRFEGRLKVKGENNVGLFFDEVRSVLRIGFLSGNGNKFGLAIFWQICVMILDVLSLYFLALALGFPISLTVAFISFVLTQFISMLSFVPGGLGVFEGGMAIFLITFGLARSVAITLTLLFRGLIFWLPLPIGWWLYRKYTQKNRIADASKSASI